MAILLSLETSTMVCSAALHEDGKLLASLESQIPQTASSQLAVLINNLFNACEVTPERIGGVVVSAGPGSYTGLRIGVATAKGFCYALNIPLLSVNTLELLAYKVISSTSHNKTILENKSALLCPMLDARRMEVYCLVADQNLNIVEQTNAKVIDELSFDTRLEKGPIYFFGNGALKCKEVISHKNASFIGDITPAATGLGELGYKKFQSKQFEELSSFEPLYLKDFVAKKPKSI